MPIVVNYGTSYCPQERQIVALLKGLSTDGFLAQNILMPDKDCPKMPNEHDIVLLVPWGAYSIESKRTDGIEKLKLEGNNPDEWMRARWLLGGRQGGWHRDPNGRRNARWTAWHKGTVLLSFIQGANRALARYPVQGIVVFSDATEVVASPNDSGIGGRWCQVSTLVDLIKQDCREYTGAAYSAADLESLFKKLEALPTEIGPGTIIHDSRLMRKRDGFQEIGCTIPVFCYEGRHEIYRKRIETRIYDLNQLDQASRRFLMRMKRRLHALEEANDACVIRVKDHHEWMEGYMVSYEIFDGLPLRDVLREYPTGLPRSLALSVILHIAETVSRLHLRPQPILHLDIRPENVLLARKLEMHRGQDHKLHGFTNPRLNREDTSQAVSLGPFGDSFVAPEIRQPSEHEPPDCRHDIYSLGALLAYCLMGEAAYSADLDDEHIIRPGTGDRNLDYLISHAAARSRSDRFRDIKRFLRVVRAQAS
jgi:hypothetical protein